MKIGELLKRTIARGGCISIKGSATARWEAAHLGFILQLPGLPNVLRRSVAHPNRFEFTSFVEVLRGLVKKIYITDYRYGGLKVPAEVVVGFGPSIKQSAYLANRFIYYATGSSSAFQSQAALDEYKLVALRFGFCAESSFRLPEVYSGFEEYAANNIYLIGNRATAETFRDVREDSIRLLPGIALGENTPTNQHCRRVNRRSILWMGSKGVLHKGLHIAAEVAGKLALRLIVIGVGPQERALAGKVLALSGCDHEVHGFVEVGSNDWWRLTSGVDVVVGCSVSEGMSTSLLTCARFGILPVSTDSCGIDVGVVVGFHPRFSLVERLASRVEAIFTLSDDEIRQIQDEAKARVNDENSVARFKERIEEYLVEDLA